MISDMIKATYMVIVGTLILSFLSTLLGVGGFKLSIVKYGEKLGNNARTLIGQFCKDCNTSLEHA